MPCWHDIQSTRSWRIAALSSFERVKNSGEKTKSGQFCVFGVETPFARVARMGKACSARFLRAAAVQTREEAMEGVGARARAMATSAAIANVRSGSRCDNVCREVAPASDRVERGVVAVAVAPSARVALGKDALFPTVCAPEQVPVLDVGGEGVSPLVGAPSAARGERVDVLRGANLLGGG
jgi:hypothetical protein